MRSTATTFSRPPGILVAAGVPSAPLRKDARADEWYGYNGHLARATSQARCALNIGGMILEFRENAQRDGFFLRLTLGIGDFLAPQDF